MRSVAFYGICPAIKGTIWYFCPSHALWISSRKISREGAPGCMSKMTSQARALFATNSEREIGELVLHLLTIRLGVTCSRCHRWSSLLRDMSQAHGHLFQGEARRTQAMAEVVPQVMERDVGDVLPLLSGCPLFDGASPGMQPAFRESPGMITSTASHFAGPL
jgi:hypothetical protein